MVSRANTAAYLANVKRRRHRAAVEPPAPATLDGVAGDASALGGTYGYIGEALGALGVPPAGSLTPDTTGGIKIDSLFTAGGATTMYNIGDSVAAIEAATLYIDGSPLTLIAATYNEGVNLTQVNWVEAPINALDQAFTVEFR